MSGDEKACPWCEGFGLVPDDGDRPYRRRDLEDAVVLALSRAGIHTNDPDDLRWMAYQSVAAFCDARH